MLNIELRNPEDVMKLSRLGSFHQSKLSFLRSFIREFKNWEFNRDIFDLDKSGYGVAVYSVRKNKRVYSLICFSQHINAEERSDRVIATKWDAAFVLHDGVPAKKDIDRLKEKYSSKIGDSFEISLLVAPILSLLISSLDLTCSF